MYYAILGANFLRALQLSQLAQGDTRVSIECLTHRPSPCEITRIQLVELVVRAAAPELHIDPARALLAMLFAIREYELSDEYGAQMCVRFQQRLCIENPPPRRDFASDADGRLALMAYLVTVVFCVPSHPPDIPTPFVVVNSHLLQTDALLCDSLRAPRRKSTICATS